MQYGLFAQPDQHRSRNMAVCSRDNLCKEAADAVLEVPHVDLARRVALLDPPGLSGRLRPGHAHPPPLYRGDGRDDGNRCSRDVPSGQVLKPFVGVFATRRTLFWGVPARSDTKSARERTPSGIAMTSHPVELNTRSEACRKAARERGCLWARIACGPA